MQTMARPNKARGRKANVSMLIKMNRSIKLVAAYRKDWRGNKRASYSIYLGLTRRHDR
jgi:hypothetical protein